VRVCRGMCVLVLACAYVCNFVCVCLSILLYSRPFLVLMCVFAKVR